MKKLTILLLFLITNFAYSQFDLVANQTNGKFSLATNNTTFMGKTAGTIQAQVDFTVSDTSSNWTLLPNQTNGKYSIITNAVTFMGKSAGTVQIPVVFDLGSVTVAFDTSLFVKRRAYNQDITAENEFTMSAETFMSISSSHDMVLLATGDMTLSSFSQSITATGGDMNITSANDFNVTATSSMSFIGGSVTMEATIGSFAFTSDQGNLAFDSPSGIITASDATGGLYWLRTFGTPSGSAVTPAVMQTVLLTLSDGTSQLVFTPVP